MSKRYFSLGRRVRLLDVFVFASANIMAIAFIWRPYFNEQSQLKNAQLEQQKQQTKSENEQNR